MTKKTKVLIVDDSALIRAILKEIIDSDPRFEVVADAKDPYEARERIKLYSPDVITLDIEMPKMNGITFLQNLMRLRPMPVLMISTLTQEGAPATLQALEIGAVDFLPKPSSGGDAALEVYRELILDKLFWAAKANVHSYEPAPVKRLADLAVLSQQKSLDPNYLCAIGASTGGTEAIKAVLQSLPKTAPPIVIAQHIPAAFSSSFAKRLDSTCAIDVFEAEHQQMIEPGCAYVAPGHSHLRVVKTPKGYQCRLDQSEPVNRHRPSVDVLYDAVLAATAGQCQGVILTGMGADGAQGLLRMRQAGAHTLAQDEASSVVWGMPGAAVKLGAAELVQPLDKIARSIMQKAYAR
jgi:two-component system, chemotaxis family, protein-glutamate methylesterase/glutaminase